MTSSKKSRDLGYYFGIFERSYAVPYSCKVSYPGVNLFRIYDEGPFWQPLPLGLYNVKKNPTWLGLNYHSVGWTVSCFTGGSECYKAITIYI